MKTLYQQLFCFCLFFFLAGTASAQDPITDVSDLDGSAAALNGINSWDCHVDGSGQLSYIYATGFNTNGTTFTLSSGSFDETSSIAFLDNHSGADDGAVVASTVNAPRVFRATFGVVYLEVLQIPALSVGDLSGIDIAFDGGDLSFGDPFFGGSAGRLQKATLDAAFQLTSIGTTLTGVPGNLIGTDLETGEPLIAKPGTNQIVNTAGIPQITGAAGFALAVETLPGGSYHYVTMAGGDIAVYDMSWGFIGNLSAISTTYASFLTNPAVAPFIGTLGVKLERHPSGNKLLIRGYDGTNYHWWAITIDESQFASLNLTVTEVGFSSMAPDPQTGYYGLEYFTSVVDDESAAIGASYATHELRTPHGYWKEVGRTTYTTPGDYRYTYYGPELQGTVEVRTTVYAIDGTQIGEPTIGLFRFPVPVQVYPTPVSTGGDITVVLDETRPYTLTLVNEAGQIVCGPQTVADTEKMTLIAPPQSGTYYVQVHSGGEPVIVPLIVVK